LVWSNISNSKFGVDLGRQRYKAINLIPGAAYIFRVKQKNSCGWSEFSKSSDLILTLATISPQIPIICTIGENYVVAELLKRLNKGVEVQLAKLESISNELLDSSNFHLNWVTVESECYQKGNCIIINKLIPGCRYIMRVRVEEIFGWSSWSGNSAVFRTLN
jgi:hypothetical protein